MFFQVTAGTNRTLYFAIGAMARDVIEYTFGGVGTEDGYDSILPNDENALYETCLAKGHFRIDSETQT